MAPSSAELPQNSQSHDTPEPDPEQTKKKKYTRPTAGEATRRSEREPKPKGRDDEIRTLTAATGPSKRKGKRKQATDGDAEEDSDREYEPSSDESGDESEASDDDTENSIQIVEPTGTSAPAPKKIAPIFLPRKTAPAPPKRKADEAEISDNAATGKGKKKKQKKLKKRSFLQAESTPAVPVTRAIAEKAAQEQDVRRATAQSTTAEGPAAADSDAQEAGNSKPRKRSVAKLFYKEATASSKGQKVKGQTYWQCIRCNKVETVSGSTGNLTTHLKKHHKGAASLLDRMLDVHKEKGFDSIPNDWITAAMTKTEDIDRFLQTGNTSRTKAATHAFDQAGFEDLLMRWLVVSDQPFSEVESVEFRALLRYLKSDLTIPKADSIREKIMEYGAGLDDDLRKYLAELKGKIHLALDAWTSSTGFAFLAVTGHYVKNDGQLEELLLDFIELEGRHTGVYMGKVVYEMLERLGILPKAGCVTADSASNNDTALRELEHLFTSWDKGVPAQPDFDEKQRRIRCLAHIIHLAALELLYALDIFKPAKKQTQDDFEADYRAELDVLRANEATLQAMAGEEKDDEEDIPYEKMGTHAAAVKKLRDFVKKIKESPLKKQALNSQIAVLPPSPDGTPVKVLALILDVKTRWSSTHRMLERAVPYREAINVICKIDTDLQKFQLSDDEWGNITTVSGWLYWFRRALEKIESHKRPTLALTVPTFNGLMSRITSLKQELIAGPHAPELLVGLDRAYNKLAQYYMHTDSSFFYTWATFLDPRFKPAFFKGRPEYTEFKTFIEACELELELYFEEHYTPQTMHAQQVPSSPEKGGGDDDMTAGLFVKAAPPSLLAQWHAYRDSPRENEKVDPLNYWQVKSGQWPELARLAQDVISIPATAVSVERIFSGGRDTLSLRRASLLPGTLSSLMRLKNWLRLLRSKNDLIVL